MGAKKFTKWRVEYFGYEWSEKLQKDVKKAYGMREFIRGENATLSKEAIAFRRATPEQLEKATQLKFWDVTA